METSCHAISRSAFRTALPSSPGSAADAEEAAQDGFVKAWRPRSRAFATASRFGRGCWRSSPTRRSTRPAGGGRRRAEWTRRAAAAEDPGERPRRGIAGADPLALAIAGEVRGELLAAVRGSSACAIAKVLSLRYLLDMSEGEMAVALGCRRGTVKSRLSRALGRLRAEIGICDEPRT